MSRLAAALDDLRALDTLAARDTALSRRDPRAKLLVTLGFVLTVLSFDRYQVAALLPLALFPAVLAAQGAVPSRTLWRALVLASPFAVMLGLFNPLLDRAPMLLLAGQPVSAGWVSLTSILLRCVLAAAATVVLLAGTGMPALCAGLARLGAPRAFTVQLLLLYRYLFLLMGEALRLNTARALRAGPRRRMPLSLVAPLMGQWLLRSIERAGRIHQAMLARGFSGDLLPAFGWRWQLADSVFVGGWCVFFVAARGFDAPHALGRWLTALAT